MQDCYGCYTVSKFYIYRAATSVTMPRPEPEIEDTDQSVNLPTQDLGNNSNAIEEEDNTAIVELTLAEIWAFGGTGAWIWNGN